eukprot:3391797-Rhodomonas_salina.1
MALSPAKMEATRAKMEGNLDVHARNVGLHAVKACSPWRANLRPHHVISVPDIASDARRTRPPAGRLCQYWTSRSTRADRVRRDWAGRREIGKRPGETHSESTPAVWHAALGPMGRPDTRLPLFKRKRSRQERPWHLMRPKGRTRRAT